ncbi:hypothetical protein QE152_g33503 [Popillia japonica]|uniref:Uncharacterized protein n=1 Tax=Popillia japonica TaxID=7064 RepID=A0AAW1IW34_POPJA
MCNCFVVHAPVVYSYCHKNMVCSISRLENLESAKGVLSPNELDRIVGEAKDRVQRDNNVIVYGFDVEGPTDRTEAANLIRALAEGSDCSENIVHVIRLGMPNSSKSRPLRIVFNNPYTVANVLKLKKKLKSHSRYRNVYIRSDQTLLQRNLYKECRNKLDERKSNGEKHLRIKYIRGAPEIVTVNQVTGVDGGGDKYGTEDNGSNLRKNM